MLQEIGRLREVTFRAAGEGTGRSSDLDLYDSYYAHLMVWNFEANEIVGAYRLGFTDEILRRNGRRRLYTQTLFKYRRDFLNNLSPAIELGRSFVRQEYSRDYAPLMLFWNGIGSFVTANPQYRILFGPVSISNDYESLSQLLLVEFLKQNCFDSNLSRLVKPRKRFRAGPSKVSVADALRPLEDITQLSRRIAGIENDKKGVPVLIRQYLKLGGHFLGFNVDPRFNNSVDGLIVLDLARTDPRMLKKYMGETQARAFLEHCRSTPANRIPLFGGGQSS